jgi:hypothetical protein
MTGDNAAGVPNMQKRVLPRKCLIRQYFSVLRKIKVDARAEGALPGIGHVAKGLAMPNSRKAKTLPQMNTDESDS